MARTIPAVTRGTRENYDPGAVVHDAANQQYSRSVGLLTGHTDLGTLTDTIELGWREVPS